VGGAFEGSIARTSLFVGRGGGGGGGGTVFPGARTQWEAELLPDRIEAGD